MVLQRLLVLGVDMVPVKKTQKKLIVPFEEILTKIRQQQDLPESLEKLLPTKWELLGDVLVIKLNPNLVKYQTKIAEIYAKELKAQTVVKELSGISGIFREPHVDVIYGTRTETLHKENKIKFKLNVAKIMFSSGNIDERMKFAKVSKPGEIVVDMFAGIGYFTLPIAVYSKPKAVYACELNPVAYKYLCENIKLNEVENIVTPLHGDCRNTAPENIADRVILGYLIESWTYLPKAFKILKAEGGTIHYHESCPNEFVPKRAFEHLRTAALTAGKKIESLKYRKIKSYAPRISHIVVDAGISPSGK